MKFKGDIIITDPCYIDTKDYQIWDGKKVDIFSGNGLSELGFTNYIWEDTIYGDWSCITLNTDNGKKLGKFCADAGLVGVFLLDEILNFNPDFKYPFNEYGVEWATLIKDFDGDIQYEIDENNEAHIIGKGNINFWTTQSGV
jgi:hypothetical protein